MQILVTVQKFVDCGYSGRKGNMTLMLKYLEITCGHRIFRN